MNKPLKIVVLFLAGMSISGVGFAQQKSNKPTESVIIMTKARLDTLLTGIAESKLARLKQRKQERLAKAKLRPQTSAKSASQMLMRGRTTPDLEKTRNAGQNNATVLQELDRINHRMDLLTMKMQNSSGGGTTIVPSSGGHAPMTVYRGGRQNRSRYSRNTEGRGYTDIRKLQDKIGALQMEIKDLGENTDSVGRKEISSLRERTDSLNTELQNANKNIQSGRQQKINRYGNSSSTAVLKKYRQAIYFANNSADLQDADKALLLQLAQMIKRSDQAVTVLVQGYASQTGPSLNNYKLSQQRANAVKNVLTSHGITANNIETLGHGVNKSQDAPAARRAEISLLIN